MTNLDEINRILFSMRRRGVLRAALNSRHPDDEQDTRDAQIIKAAIHQLIDEIARLRADAARLDWLADPDNQAGNVQLPTDCVLAHPESMRAAIDMAMRMEV